MRRLLLVLSFIFVCSPVLARTWYVEKDGSGDFSVIQDAVEAAASQDTIRIGPGRFDDWTVYGPDWNQWLDCIYISQPEMTIIGSGPDLTVIGQDIPWGQEQGNLQGLFATETCARLHVEGIRFQNMKKGIYMGRGDRSTFNNCGFVGLERALSLGNATSVVEDCSFQGILSGGKSILSYFQEEILISHCTSETEIQLTNKHIQVEGPSRVLIEQCVFRGASAGMTLSRGPHAVLTSCIFEGQSKYGINLATGAPSCTITACIFRNQGSVFLDSNFPGGEWKIERTIIENVSSITLVGNYLDHGYIRDCILAKGEHGVVAHGWLNKGLDPSPENETVSFDMRNNWWGTADPDSIRAWIRDVNDDKRINFSIDFEPFNDQPVTTEKKSFGDVRSIFR